MNRAGSLAIVAVLAGVALADAPPPPPPGPVDPIAVAGRYTATLRWSKCTADGRADAAFELRPVDSRLELDLAGIRDGMPVVAIAGDSAELTGTYSDLTATLRWRTPTAITVAIDLDSGCTVRGTARRDTSGIAACDQLAALARIETGCAAIAATDRKEDVVALDRARAGWSRTRGAKRRAAGDSCRLRADALRPALIDAACLAIPAEDAPVAIAECRDLAGLVARLSLCRALPDDVRAQLRAAVAQITTHLDPSAGREQLDPTRAVCLDMTDRLREIQRRFGCD